jgi:hypothetical protein
VDALRLRQRLGGLRVLRPAPMQEQSLAMGEAGSDDYRAWFAEGAQVPDGLVAAAIVHARNEELVAIDVIPTDWPGLDGLSFSRRTDTRSYRTDKLALGTSAACMLVASVRHLERVPTLPASVHISPRELARLSECLKSTASDRVTHRVGPGLVAPSGGAWSAVVAAGSSSNNRMPVAGLLLSSLGWFFGLLILCTVELPPQARLGLGAALMLWLFQPAIALGGGSWSPNDLAALIWSRPLIQAQKALKMLKELSESSVLETVRYSSTDEESIDSERSSAPDGALAQIRVCPVCNETGGVSFDVRDVWRNKPGIFRWLRCRCGTVYAERLLSEVGHRFYWAEPPADDHPLVWSAWHRKHRGRNETRCRFVARRFEPHAWLDLNCGDAAFGAIASQMLPGTEFEGVDALDSVHFAARRRWLDRGHKGVWAQIFQEVLRHRRYDVISAWNGLERYSDPTRVLHDVRSILTDRGVLALELLDPTALDAVLLSSIWPGWNAPYQSQLLPFHTAIKCFKDSGWCLLRCERRRTHRIGAVTYAWVHRCRSLQRRTRTRLNRESWTVRGGTICLLGLPFTSLIDLVVSGLAVLLGRTNTYRVLLRPESLL